MHGRHLHVHPGRADLFPEGPQQLHELFEINRSGSLCRFLHFGGYKSGHGAAAEAKSR